MAHCPTTVAEYQSGGSGCRMGLRLIGWPSIGKRSAVLQFRPQVLLAMGPASFANSSHMNSRERLILRFLRAGENVDWRVLLTGAAATVAPKRAASAQTLLSIRYHAASASLAASMSLPALSAARQSAMLMVQGRLL